MVKLSVPHSEVLRVIREHTCYELAETYVLRVEKLCKLLLEVLDCGTLCAKVFIVMYMQRGDWTCSDLAHATSSYRQKVYNALKKLLAKGYVRRVSRHKWTVTTQIVERSEGF
jgi:predicted transcriptional regulator